MDKIYYSPQNFQLLFKNLNNYYNGQLKQKDSKNIILQCMDYVWNNNNHNLPNGVSREKFLYRLNSQIIQLCKNSLSKKINNLQNNKNNKFNQMFDGITQRSMPNEILDLPRPQAQLKSEINNESYLNNIIDERNNLIPKKDNINFEDKKYQNEKEERNNVNFDNIYEDKMNERKKLEFNSPYNQNNNYGTPLEDIYDDYNLKVIDEQQSIYNNDNDSDNDSQLMSTPIENNLTEKVIINENNFDNKFLNNNPNIIDKNVIIKQDYEKPFYEKDNINVVNNSEHFSDFNNNSSSVILPPKNNLIEKKFFINISSLNRDLEIYPDPTNFQVKYSPSSNNIIIQSYYSKSGILIYKEKIIIYGNQGATISRTYENILDIKCNSAIMPYKINYFNVNREPYLLLIIDELKGPYEGTNKTLTNAFAKLINDAKIKGPYELFIVNDDDESYYYDTTSLGIIDKMTLKLQKHNQDNYLIGIDKLYVSSFNESNEINNELCLNNDKLTEIVINNNSELYKNYCHGCKLNKTYLEENDLLYFYDTSPEECNVVYFEKNIKINSMQLTINDNLIINAVISKSIYEDYYEIINNESYEKILFNEIFFQNNDYYIYLSYSDDNTDYVNNIFLKVLEVNNENIIIEKFDDYDPNINYEIYKFGFTFKNKKGRQSEDKNSLFSKFGISIKSIDDSNGLKITLNFPYNKLPDYLQENNDYVFFIQDKLQIHYTFKVTELIKDNKILQSRLV